ncbi:MAG: hypothetical protein Unbinned6437contig1000_6 [Prokaryotic dsDNA virus sp.]|nr:MAG: hypothetical protein Unbinned6437contig1000_6 [Prokaryotic dsDNA virus sp.]|tara:strand:+ start:41049 stop:41600 length:552 start_codon:yes stop_codon:yes gene_type:complete
MKEKKIFYASDEAAQFKTGISGWVSSDGRFFGDNEHLARYCGCTHKNCEKCGGEILVNSYCESCHKKGRLEKFKSYELVEWDGKHPFAIFDTDEFFFDFDSFSDYVTNNELNPNNLRLVLCEPNYMRQVEADYWEDEFPEGGDDSCIPGDILSALETLNELIGNKKEILSWYQGNKRIETPKI